MHYLLCVTRLRSELSPHSQYPGKFSDDKSGKKEDEIFPICHVTSCWSCDQRVMRFVGRIPLTVSQHVE